MAIASTPLPNTGLNTIGLDDTESGESAAIKINAVMEYLETNPIRMQGFMNPNKKDGGFVGKSLTNGSPDFTDGEYVIASENGYFDFAIGVSSAAGSGTKMQLGDRYTIVAGKWQPVQPPASRNKGWFNPQLQGGGLNGIKQIINGSTEYKNGDYLIANHSANYDFVAGARDPGGDEVKVSDRIAYDGSKWFVLQASLGLMQGWFNPNKDGGGLSLKESVSNSATTYVFGEYIIAQESGKYDFTTGMTGTASAEQVDVGTIMRWEGNKWDKMVSLHDNPNKGFCKFDIDGGDVFPAIQNGGGYNEGDFFIALVGGIYDFSAGTTELKINPRTVNIDKGDVVRMGKGDTWELVAERGALGDDSSVPVGTITMYASLTPPKGYLLCNGSAIPGQYKKLLALCGNMVPDLRGQFVRGAAREDQITGFPQTAATTALPNSNFTTSTNGSHIHGVNSNGDHTHDMWRAMSRDDRDGDSGSNSEHGGTFTGGSGQFYKHRHTNNAGSHNHSINSGGDHSHSVTGGGDPETAPDHIRLAYMIKHD